MERRPSSAELNRRQFVKRSGALLAAFSLPLAPPMRKDAGANAVEVCIFSKHLQWLDYEGMAQTAAELGFDGVDLTVRPRGHVEPERVEEDLPRAVEAVKRAGLSVPMMATAITDPDDPLTPKILQTASKLGIRYYRMGYWRYPKDKSPAAVLEDLRNRARRLEELNREFGIVGDYQNHSGRDRVGAAVWDLWYIMKDLDPRWIGVQFDVRHATVEGGYSWPTDFRLVADRVHTVDIKDFRWAKLEGGWQTQNCPLGDGMTDFATFLRMLKAVGFRGPMSIHFEYPLGGANKGARQLTVPKERVLAHMKRDLETLRGWLKEYGVRG